MDKFYEIFDLDNGSKFERTRVKLSKYLEEVSYDTKCRIQNIQGNVLFEGSIRDFYGGSTNSIFNKEVFSVLIEENTLILIVI